MLAKQGAAAVLLVLAFVGVARGDEGTVRFFAVAELRYRAEHHATIRNGKPAPPEDWPASFYSSDQCTSTLVGPRALITAKHCVGESGRIVLEGGGSSVKGACTKAPGSGRGFDLAACLLEESVEGVLYESVGSGSGLVAVGAPVLLTGFGCAATDTPSDGVFRIGMSTVRALPTADDYRFQTQGGAAVCFGDSGAAAYAVQGGNLQRRVQVGVNSSAGGNDTSYVVSLVDSRVREFLRRWSQRHSAPICGLSDEATGCR